MINFIKSSNFNSNDSFTYFFVNQNYCRSFNDQTELFPIHETHIKSLPYISNLQKERFSSLKKSSKVELFSFFFSKNPYAFSIFFDFLGGFSSGYTKFNRRYSFPTVRIHSSKLLNPRAYSSFDSLSSSQSWYVLNKINTSMTSLALYDLSNSIIHNVNSAIIDTTITNTKLCAVSNKVWISSRLVSSKLQERGNKVSMVLSRQNYYNSLDMIGGKWLSVFFGVAPNFVFIDNLEMFIKYDFEIATNCFNNFFLCNLLPLTFVFQDYFLKKMNAFWNIQKNNNRVVWFFIFFLLLSSTKQSYYISMSFFRNCVAIQNYNRLQWWHYESPIYQLQFFKNSVLHSNTIHFSPHFKDFYVSTNLNTTLISGIMF